MMLRHLGESAAADTIEDAVLVTLEEGKAVTQDLARQTGGDVEHAASTTGFTDAIIANLGRQPATVPPRTGVGATVRRRDAAAALVVRCRSVTPRSSGGRSAWTSSWRTWPPVDALGPALEALAGDVAASRDDLQPRHEGLPGCRAPADGVRLCEPGSSPARTGAAVPDAEILALQARVAARFPAGRTWRSSTSSTASPASRRPRASKDPPTAHASTFLRRTRRTLGA